MALFHLSCLLAFTGGHMVNYAVILYLQERVGSDLWSGVGFGLSFGSSIVFGWFAGVLCDRIAPTRVIHAAQALFLLCLGTLCWTEYAAAEPTRLGWTLGSALLGGLAWSFAGPARLATLGQIASPQRLRSATIIFNLQVLLGFGLAPVLIGLVRSRSGWPAVFASAMALFVASSLLLLGTRTCGSALPRRGVWAEFGEGLAALRADPLLWQLLLAAAVAYAMTGPMQILLPRLARGPLGLSELQRGAYLGLMALSLIGGGVSALFLARRLHQGAAICAGTVLASLLFATLALWGSAALSALVLAAMGLLGGMVISFIIAGIQARAPSTTRGRIMALYAMVSQVVPAGSGVAAGALLGAIGPSDAILAAGLALAGIALLATRLMPQLRRHPG